jgi:nitroreductase/NAD-dependent dihydropyrimidine dehydrogenase PreA subunit
MPIVHSRYPESGTVTIAEESCTKCGLCARACPADVLVLDGEGLRVNEKAPFGCIACGHCMMVCPTGSITVSGRGLSPEDCVELPPPEARASESSLAALMGSRRSVRRFKPDEVPREVLERVVELASSAPMGIPPWDVGVTVVHGREQVQKLAEEIITGYRTFLRIFKPWVITVMRPLMGRATCELFRSFVRPLAQMMVAGRNEGRDLLFWNAPAVMIFHRAPYADDADSTIACTYAMLGAEAIGLGTTVIGSAAPILKRNKTLAQSYGIPPANKPAITMILGYPAVRFQRAVRRHFTSVDFV